MWASFNAINDYVNHERRGSSCTRIARWIKDGFPTETTMKIWVPLYLDCNNCQVKAKWFVLGENKDEAYQNAVNYIKSVPDNEKIYLCPHNSAFFMVDVKEVVFHDNVAIL